MANSSDTGAAEFPNDLLDMSEHECFTHLAGFVVKHVTKHTGHCEQRKTASVLTKLKSYTGDCKPVQPVPAVPHPRNSWKYVSSKQQQAPVQWSNYFISQLFAKSNDCVQYVNCFPSYDNIQERLLTAFLKTRIHIFLWKENILCAADEAKSAKTGSHSIGKQASTSNVK